MKETVNGSNLLSTKMLASAVAFSLKLEYRVHGGNRSSVEKVSLVHQQPNLCDNEI